MSYTDSSYGLFQGSLYLQERNLNSTNLTGYQFVGDVDMFAIDQKQKFDDIEESQTGLGLNAAHIVIGTDVSVKLRALDIKFANWIRATWGGGGTAVASGSVTGESVTFYNGESTKLAHMGVSSLVLTTTPSLVLNTDYTLDATNGVITILAASTNVVAGTPLAGTAAYTKAAYMGRLQAFTTGQRYYRAMLLGRNAAQGNQPVQIIVNQIAFEMAAALSLIDKKHINFDLSGKCLQDTTIATPVASTDTSQFFTVSKAA